MAFSPYYNLYGQPMEEDRSPFGDMFRPKRPPYEERLFPSAAPVIPEAPPAQPSLMDALSQVYNRPPGPAMSAYSEFIQRGAPKPEDYQPTKMGRLGAILSGIATGMQNPAAGYGAAQSIIRQPYEQALGQYGMQKEQLKEAAGLEDMMGQRQHQTAKMIQDAYKAERDDQRADALAESLINTRNLNMERTKQLIENEGMTWRENNITGELTLVWPSGKTKVVGKFNPSTEEKTQSDREMERYRSGLMAGRQRDLASIQFENQKALKQVPAITDRDKPARISPSAQTTATVSAAQELLNDPKYFDLNKIVELNSAGYKINRPSATGFMGMKKDNSVIDTLIKEFEDAVRARAEEKINLTTIPVR